jgi:catechol 2,3-dioxygenase-like lactoylglutathione lyase family enzyme
MIVQSLDHVNIRVKDPAATIAFFNDVLGMPSSPVRNYWLIDAAGNPATPIAAKRIPLRSAEQSMKSDRHGDVGARP